MKSDNAVIAQESILLDVPRASAREFIKTPGRILDYYPGGSDCGFLEQGRSFYCKGIGGISLLEIVGDEIEQVKLQVYTAIACSKPYNAEEIKNNAFFTMLEEWRLEERGSKTLLHKSWLHLEKIKYRFLPMAWIIQKSVKKESQVMATRWKQVAKKSEVLETAGADKEYVKNKQKRITLVAQGMLDGSIQYLEGAIELVSLREEVGVYANDPDFLAFVAISAEVDQLSIEKPCESSPKEAHEKYELKIQESIEWAKSFSLSNCKSLAERYRA